MALSTLRPATSPRLSVIELDFTSSTSARVENMTAGVENDLRRIADEIARIECVFEGTAKVAVVPDSKFRVVLDTLNVRFCSVGWKRPLGRVG